MDNPDFLIYPFFSIYTTSPFVQKDNVIMSLLMFLFVFIVFPQSVSPSLCQSILSLLLQLINKYCHLVVNSPAFFYCSKRMSWLFFHFEFPSILYNQFIISKYPDGTYSMTVFTLENIEENLNFHVYYFLSSCSKYVHSYHLKHFILVTFVVFCVDFRHFLKDLFPSI